MPPSIAGRLLLVGCVAVGVVDASVTSAKATPAASSIAAGPIASLLGSTGLLPEGVPVDLAAQYIASIANNNLAAIGQALSQPGLDPKKILDPEGYYSYGRSPPVYPSPPGEGTGDWAQAYAQARHLVAQMTAEEKNNITTPASDFQGCSGLTGSVPRLKFPGICLNDGPAGLRLSAGAKGGSAFPAQLSIGASWNRSLAYSRGYHMGREFRNKGVNVALGPVLGPLGRTVRGGRNWEGFGSDPYLAGALADPTIRGLQGSVIACAKHFIANEQETNRNPFLTGVLAPLGVELNASVSANVDDRTMHELYLWPFADAVHAGVGSVMASYNRINNSYGAQNSKTLNGLLKRELGFQGFVVSDWHAQHTGVASAEAGLDLVMPSAFYWGNHQLVRAVNNGSLPASRLDDMATRILAAWFRSGQPPQTPGVTPHASTDPRDPGSEAAILQAAIEGHVLLKNTASALPLRSPRTLSVFGYDAPGGINSSLPDATLYPYGLANTRQFPDDRRPFAGLDYLLSLVGAAPSNHSIPAVALNGTLEVAGGSGAALPPSSVSPLDALALRAARDRTSLFHDPSANPLVPHPEGPCLVLLNAQAAESADRPALSDAYSDGLVEAVAGRCAKTIVVMHNAGPRLVDPWIEHENVSAVVFAHLPGQASGPALVEVLYGGQSPSGRLPYTLAREEGDYGGLEAPGYPTKEDPQYSQVEFAEGLGVDYRGFIQRGVKPRFGFGFGLTYASFEYGNLTVAGNASAVARAGREGEGEGCAGGMAELFEEVARVGVTVRNTGKVAAAEVAQLYLGIPNSGVAKALRGFDKKLIQPGKKAVYSFPLRARDVSVWDVVSQRWVVQKGCHKVYVGKSVLDIQLKGQLCL